MNRKAMGLRTQVLIGSVATVLLPILLAGGWAYSALRAQFAELEIVRAEREMLRVLNVLNSRVEDLQRTVRDYAYWDSMYEFAGNPTQEFVNENVIPDSVASLGAELWMARTPSGSPLASLFVDRSNAQVLPWTLGLEQLFSPSSPMGKVGTGERRGIFRSRDEIWMVASAPILRSDRSGAQRGEFVMATRLGAAEAAQIAETLQVRAVFSPTQPPKPKAAVDRGEGVWLYMDGETVQGCQSIRSPDNSVAGWVVVHLDRPFYKAATALLGLVLVVSGLLGLFSTVGVAWWIGHRVVGRLESLSRFAQSSAQSDAGVTMPDLGSDEIGEIARTVAASLRDLSSYHRIVDSVPAVVLLFDDSGRCTYANRHAAAFLQSDPSASGASWEDLWVEEDGSPLQRPSPDVAGRAWTRSEPRRLLVFHTARVELGTSSSLLLTGFDGTAQLEAERATELARQALEASPMPVFILFENGRIEWANDAARSLSDSGKAFHPGFLAAAFEDPFWVRAVQTEGPVAVSGTLHTHPSRCLEGSAVRLATSRGPRVIAFLHDLSEFKATFERLEQSERRFRSVIGSLAAGLVMADQDGRILMENEALRQLCGPPAGSELQSLPLQWTEPLPKLLARVAGSGVTVQTTCYVETEARRLQIHATLFPIGDQIGVLLQDETDQLRAHEALAEALEAAADYRRAFEESPDGAVVLSAELVVLRCNSAWRDLAGACAGAGAAFVSTFLDCDRGRVAQTLQARVEAGGGSARFDGRLRSPEGAIRWVSVLATAVDEPRRILVTVRDVTEARKSEERLLRTLEHQTQLARLFEVSPDLHCVADADGRILIANDSLCKLFSLDPVELIGLPLSDLVSVEKRAEFEAAIQRAAAMGASVSDFRTPCPVDEGTLQIAWSFAFDPDRGLLYVAGRDTTHEQNRRQQLEQTASQMRALMSGISEAVIATDSDGLVQHWSESAERMFGIRASAAKGRRLADLIAHPDDAERFELSLRQMRGHERSSVSLRGRTSDGGTVLLEGSLTWTQSGGSELAVFVLADATRQAEAERRLGELDHRLQQLQRALEESGATVWVWRADPPYETVWCAGATQWLSEGAAPPPLQELVSPLDRDWFLAALRDAVSQGQGQLNLEFRLRGDATRWVQGRFVLPARTSTGAIQGVLEDVTERRIAEEALKEQNAELERLRALLEERNAILAQQSERLGASLQESEAARRKFEAAAQRYRRFVDGLPVACVACDPEGRVVEWNRAAEQLFDRRTHEAMGRELAALITRTPLEAHDWSDLHRRALDGESWPAVERPFRRPNGTQGWAVVGAIGLKDLQGESSGVLFACYDVSHRREEDARREATALQLNELTTRLMETQAELERWRRLAAERGQDAA